MVTVWDMVLSPLGSIAGDTVPSRAEPLPEWNWVVLAVGGSTPPVVHAGQAVLEATVVDVRALADGVTALDCADSGPGPAGLDAVTVNV